MIYATLAGLIIAPISHTSMSRVASHVATFTARGPPRPRYGVGAGRRRRCSVTARTELRLGVDHGARRTCPVAMEINADAAEANANGDDYRLLRPRAFSLKRALKRRQRRTS